MKNCFAKLFAAAVGLLVAGPALAQGNIATVNLQQAFNGYWKTRELDLALQRKVSAFNQEDQKLIAGWKKEKADYLQLLDEAEDSALSRAERRQKEAAAENKLDEMKSTESDIAEFEQQTRADLAAEEERQHKQLLADIAGTVSDCAKAAGDTWVLVANPRGFGLSADPVVVYSDPKIDITRRVLAQLNAGAPVELPKMPGGVSKAAADSRSIRG